MDFLKESSMVDGSARANIVDIEIEFQRFMGDVSTGATLRAQAPWPLSAEQKLL